MQSGEQVKTHVQDAGGNPDVEVHDGISINVVTGEVLDVEPNADALTVQLPRLARALRAIERRLVFAAEYQKAEAARIVETTQRKIESLAQQYENIQKYAEGLLKQSGQKDAEFPGLGKFRYKKTRESVDDSQYSLVNKSEVKRNFPDCFTTREVLTPAKKIIMEKLKAGEIIPGFSIREAGQAFEFKAEK